MSRMPPPPPRGGQDQPPRPSPSSGNDQPQGLQGFTPPGVTFTPPGTTAFNIPEFQQQPPLGFIRPPLPPMNLPQYMPPPIEEPPPLPPGFIGPATLHPILNGVVIGHTAIGNPWFAVPATPMPWHTPSRTPTSSTATGPIQLHPELHEFTKAISEAIRSASPINFTGAPGTATVSPKPVDPILHMCTTHLNSALQLALPHSTASAATHSATARRGLSFDGSPAAAEIEQFIKQYRGPTSSRS